MIAKHDQRNATHTPTDNDKKTIATCHRSTTQSAAINPPFSPSPSTTLPYSNLQTTIPEPSPAKMKYTAKKPSQKGKKHFQLPPRKPAATPKLTTPDPAAAAAREAFESYCRNFKPPDQEVFEPNPAQYRAAKKIKEMYQDKGKLSKEERMDAVKEAKAVMRESPGVRKVYSGKGEEG
ncbi:MAG: hypothetical protein Q9180_006706 [Flavoplaca navasiana]